MSYNNDLFFRANTVRYHTAMLPFRSRWLLQLQCQGASWFRYRDTRRSALLVVVPFSTTTSGPTTSGPTANPVLYSEKHTKKILKQHCEVRGLWPLSSYTLKSAWCMALLIHRHDVSGGNTRDACLRNGWEFTPQEKADWNRRNGLLVQVVDEKKGHLKQKLGRDRKKHKKMIHEKKLHYAAECKQALEQRGLYDPIVFQKKKFNNYTSPDVFLLQSARFIAKDLKFQQKELSQQKISKAILAKSQQKKERKRKAKMKRFIQSLGMGGKNERVR